MTITGNTAPHSGVEGPVELLRAHFSGAYLLHYLTVAAPLATIIIASGALGWKRALQLILLGVVITGATFGLTSVVSTASYSTIEYGAPMAYARAAWDAGAGQRLDIPTLVRANLIGDLAFWCSTTVVFGSILGWTIRRLLSSNDRSGRRRPTRRRRQRAVALREPHPWRRELELPARV